MLLPENIDLGISEKYVLNVRIRPDGFSFSIHDPDDSECYTYLETFFENDAPLNDNIQQLIFDYGFLTNNFKKTNVVFVSSQYELIPSAYFDKQKMDQLFSFSHNEQSSLVMNCESKIQENELIYNVDNGAYLFLLRSLYIPRFYHHSDLLIRYFEKKCKKLKVNSMFVYFYDNFTDIFCFNNKLRIIHTHTYVNESEEDIAFYILNLWKILDFKQVADHLYIYGYLKDSQIVHTLNYYINKVYYIRDSEQIAEFGEKTRNVPLDIAILSV